MDPNVQPTEAALAGVIVMATQSKQFALWDVLDNDGKVDLEGSSLRLCFYKRREREREREVKDLVHVSMERKYISNYGLG